MRDLLTWLLVTTLTISPLMAQSPSAPNLKINTNGRRLDNSLLGTSILTSLPSRSEAAAMPALPRAGEAPGKNKSIIIGLLILAGAATAVILLWPNGHDKPEPVPPVPVTPAPTGTILTAGTPTVSTP